MTLSDIGKEFLHPLTDSVLLIAILVFGGGVWFSLLVIGQGPLAFIFGLLLLLLVMTTMFRYGMDVLEARMNARKTPVADIDTLTPFSNLWTLFPFALFYGYAYVVTRPAVGEYALAVGLSSIVFVMLFPAILAVLAITHSPLESLRPSALFHLIRRCGWSYLWIPFVVGTSSFAAERVGYLGVPELVFMLMWAYAFFLMFTVTGAVVHESGVVADIDISSPLPTNEKEVASEVDNERQNVANHAYGFISRGNREGGFKHIREWIKSDPDPDEAVSWFFNEMMRWETREPALFFAQECLAHFLHHEQDAMALKLMSRCFHEEPRWKPRREDRDHAIALAERYGREDLLKSLRG